MDLRDRGAADVLWSLPSSAKDVPLRATPLGRFNP